MVADAAGPGMSTCLLCIDYEKQVAFSGEIPDQQASKGNPTLMVRVRGMSTRTWHQVPFESPSPSWTPSTTKLRAFLSL